MRMVNRGPRPSLYIMKAYHIYDDKRSPVVEDLVNDLGGEGFILFGSRFNGKGNSNVAAISHGQPSESYAPGSELLYTIDTGNGYKCYGYSFTCTGWLKVNADGTPGEMRGTVPALLDKCNAFVFK